MFVNKTCSVSNGAKKFLRTANLTKYELAKQIRLPLNQSVKVLSQCNNLNSDAKSALFTNNLVHGKTLERLPASNLSLQYRMGSSNADHVKLWQMERITSAALPIVLPAAFIMENPLLDSLLAVLVVVHTHWGLEAIVVDYARPIIMGTVLPKILHLLLSFLSAVTLAGLLVLIYNGPGIAKTVKNVWNIGKEESVEK
ncbi:succinate dehydrogenase [ubiquinone] cytochrome b small subunit, mitochondrial [Leptopilina boulardi]|uniref:succinate dehydrogenase [ubiquinone] cytochrome b small subunit, mitochondrial n=1 Tax=Leptopilina boulardi TaxID=63433 RepID=UPI0021F55A89|nr:succinate dehydrogenase [ubiquinone] cytochrome b small subunit, mitochondrial [Leptopilina boulardi]